MRCGMGSANDVDRKLVDFTPPNYHVGAGSVGLSVSLDNHYANISKDAAPALGFRNCLARDSQPGMFEC